MLTDGILVGLPEKIDNKELQKYVFEKAGLCKIIRLKGK